MTLAELEAMPDEFISCGPVSELLRCKYDTLHTVAMKNPERLGFPVTVLGNRVRIPRRAFIRYLKGTLGQEDE